MIDEWKKSNENKKKKQIEPKSLIFWNMIIIYLGNE